MGVFGWISERSEPPREWDLRAVGWTMSACEARGALARQGACACEPTANERFPLLCDYHATSAARLSQLGGLRRRILLLGVDGSLERAGLLAAQFADALPSATGLRELAERASRVARHGDEIMPRHRSAGVVRLDLFHRDGWVQGRWLGLHPREFALLWRLAERPGQRANRRELLADVWRLHHEPETNRVEVHVSRLRAKLSAVGINGLVATDPGGGYYLAISDGVISDGAINDGIVSDGAGPALPLKAGGELDTYVRLVEPAPMQHDEVR